MGLVAWAGEDFYAREGAGFLDALEADVAVGYFCLTLIRQLERFTAFDNQLLKLPIHQQLFNLLLLTLRIDPLLILRKIIRHLILMNTHIILLNIVPPSKRLLCLEFNFKLININRQDFIRVDGLFRLLVFVGVEVSCFELGFGDASLVVD